MTTVDPSTLIPSTFRDLIVDPVDRNEVDLRADPARVAFLRVETIPTPDGFEVLYHSEVVAAAIIARRPVEIETVTGDDRTKVLAIAHLNALYRLDRAAALRGTVAVVVRHIARAILAGTPETMFPANRDSLERLRRQLVSPDGLATMTVAEFLRPIKAISRHDIQAAVYFLKSDGHYARILREERAHLETLRAEQAKTMDAAVDAAQDVALARARLGTLIGAEWERLPHVKNPLERTLMEQRIAGWRRELAKLPEVRPQPDEPVVFARRVADIAAKTIPLPQPVRVDPLAERHRATTATRKRREARLKRAFEDMGRHAVALAEALERLGAIMQGAPVDLPEATKKKLETVNEKLNRTLKGKDDARD